MENELKKHPMGFMYKELNDGTGRISVSKYETQKYLNKKPVYLDGIDDNGEDWLIRFTDTLKRGRTFHKVDMFGRKYIVEKEELIEYIQKHYKPKIRKNEERYLSICSEHLLRKISDKYDDGNWV